MVRRVVATSLLLACSGCFDPKPSGVLDGPVVTDDGSATPGGETCAEATPLDGPGEVLGSTVGRVDDYAGTGVGCPGSQQPKPDVVYAIDVPPATRLEVAVDPQGNFDSSLMIVDEVACGGAPSSCLGGDDTGDPDAPDVASWVNPGGAAARALIVVDGYDAADGEGVFALHTSFNGGAAGESCATPTVLSGVGQLVYQTTAGFRSDYDDSPCVAPTGLVGGDRVYRLDVPDARPREITLDPGHAFDPLLYVVQVAGDGTTCGTTCVAQSDVAGDGVGETVTITGAGSYWIVVDGPASGAFSLAVREP